MHKNVSFMPGGSSQIAHGSKSMEFVSPTVSIYLPERSEVFNINSEGEYRCDRFKTACLEVLEDTISDNGIYLTL